MHYTNKIVQQKMTIINYKNQITIINSTYKGLSKQHKKNFVTARS